MAEYLRELSDEEIARVETSEDKYATVLFDSGDLILSAEQALPHVLSGATLHMLQEDQNGNLTNGTVAQVEPRIVKSVVMAENTFNSHQDRPFRLALNIVSQALRDGFSGIAFSREPITVSEPQMA